MLRVRGLCAGYGQVPVLDGVDLDLDKGEILCLLGRNGAGKTTLMRSLMGLIRPTAGSVVLGEERIDTLRPHQIARRGLAYVPQGRGIFPKLTVRENLELGTRARTDGKGRVPEEIFEHFPRLKERINQLGGTLSGGEQQMLALGRALASTPDVLLLDEPSEGIQPSIVHEIGELLTRIVATTGISVLLVEQNIDLAVQAARRGVVMEKGRIVKQGTTEELSREDVMREYLAI
ncbi:ABC transporter ATP-binding protein [Rhodoligotrophos defluvii]|uniref:ABC transporter ATP-binding protein n=1 Tax=Rhodoligotrophos defluvii TaxID=2561934 RepID=UPI0010CA0E45|nr:ABC transporter ATP-binding protein [Rhodoligotrophos defluvii]